MSNDFSNLEPAPNVWDSLLRARLVAACQALGVTPPGLRDRVVTRLREVRVSRSFTQVTRFVSDQDGVVIEQYSRYTEVRTFIELPVHKMLPSGPAPVDHDDDTASPNTG